MNRHVRRAPGGMIDDAADAKVTSLSLSVLTTGFDGESSSLR
jgi:hypothetical protein